MLIAFSSLAALQVMTTSGAASDEKVINMTTFLFQCCRHIVVLFITHSKYTLHATVQCLSLSNWTTGILWFNLIMEIAGLSLTQAQPAWMASHTRARLGRVRPLERLRSEIQEQRWMPFLEEKWPKWHWGSRSMTFIFNTSQEYLKMHVRCKLWWVLAQTNQIP